MKLAHAVREPGYHGHRVGTLAYADEDDREMRIDLLLESLRDLAIREKQGEPSPTWNRQTESHSTIREGFVEAESEYSQCKQMR